MIGKAIVSLTSYGERLRKCLVDNTIRTILNQTIKPFKIVLCLFNEDVKYCSEYLRTLIANKNIELLVCNEDIGPHKKYYHTMMKYRNNPIILLDDDILYTNDVIESLLINYIKYPNCINSRRCHNITFNNDGTIKPYKQ